MAEGSNLNQFQLMPQVVPVFRPQQLPPPPLQNAQLRMPGQPIFSVPTHFGYTPGTWTPIHHFPTPPTPSTPPRPSTPQSVYNHVEKKDDHNVQQQLAYNNNGYYTDNLQNEQQSPRRLTRNPLIRNVANKFDTRHEEFRKYLEEMGILSTFTNILSEMYQDPLRPSDSLGFIRDKLTCSQPEMIELSNLRLWCEQYQTKIMRLEKELKHVIERLRKHEPYNTDDSLFECSAKKDNKTCKFDIEK